MRRALLLAVVLGAMSVAESALAGTPTAPSSGISGEVRNTTCPGPCQDPPPPAPLYTGDGLVVKIRDRATHELFAVLHPKDGTFKVAAGPGAYHVRAYIHFKGDHHHSCWSGSHTNVGIVDRGAFVSLTVHNDCIVSPLAG
jgi:hypothetical protein